MPSQWLELRFLHPDVWARLAKCTVQLFHGFLWHSLQQMDGLNLHLCLGLTNLIVEVYTSVWQTNFSCKNSGNIFFSFWSIHAPGDSFYFKSDIACIRRSRTYLPYNYKSTGTAFFSGSSLGGLLVLFKAMLLLWFDWNVSVLIAKSLRFKHSKVKETFSALNTFLENNAGRIYFAQTVSCKFNVLVEKHGL